MHSGMGVLNYFFMGLWVLNCLFCVSYHFDHSNFELKVQYFGEILFHDLVDQINSPSLLHNGLCGLLVLVI